MANLEHLATDLPDTEQPSYIDYETFLAPDFDAAAFANSLVLATNDPDDLTHGSLDLATPLSRVLFDIQEVDAHIDRLTTRSAVPFLAHTRAQTEASTRLVADLQPQMDALNASYAQLERQVLHRYAEAEEVRQTAQRLWTTQRLGRAIGRCLQLGRQLEAQYAEVLGDDGKDGKEGKEGNDGKDGNDGKNGNDKDGKVRSVPGDYRALVRCAHTLLSLRQLLQQTSPGGEGYGLGEVEAIRTLQSSLVAPLEKTVRDTADRTVREFSLGATSSAGTLTFSQTEDAKARTVSSLLTLYLLSPTTPRPATTTTTTSAKSEAPWSPTLLTQALEAYLRAALQSSLSATTRSLGSLPTLERTLAEVSARCQNIVALEAVLAAIPPPEHPLVTGPVTGGGGSLLQVVLARLETGSLPSYFWRSLASSLSPRVQDVMSRGGIAARTLRTNKNNVGEAIRACVTRGMAGHSKKGDKTAAGGTSGAGWEREVAVMVGSVTAHLGR